MDAAAMVLVLLREALPSCAAHADDRYHLHALRWPAALAGKVCRAAVAFLRSCGDDTVFGGTAAEIAARTSASV